MLIVDRAGEVAEGLLLENKSKLSVRGTMTSQLQAGPITARVIRGLRLLICSVKLQGILLSIHKSEISFISAIFFFTPMF